MVVWLCCKISCGRSPAVSGPFLLVKSGQAGGRGSGRVFVELRTKVRNGVKAAGAAVTGFFGAKKSTDGQRSWPRLDNASALYNALEMFFKSTASTGPLLKNILLQLAKCVGQKQTEVGRSDEDSFLTMSSTIRQPNHAT